MSESKAIISAILETLKAELQTVQSAAKAACAAAADPDSKAENKYDTRTLEASYLARGVGLRAVELASSISDYELLALTLDAPSDRARTGSLITVIDDVEEIHYFLGPSGGGLEVTVADRPIIVITPASPLGSRLAGQRAGATFELVPGRAASRVSIKAMS